MLWIGMIFVGTAQPSSSFVFTSDLHSKPMSPGICWLFSLSYQLSVIRWFF